MRTAPPAPRPERRMRGAAPRASNGGARAPGPLSRRYRSDGYGGTPGPVSPPPGLHRRCPPGLALPPWSPAMLSQRMQELEEVSKELLKVLLSDWANNLLRRGLDRWTRMDDKLLLTQVTAAQLVKELSTAEETVAETLLEQESRLQQSLRRLQGLEDELLRAQEDDGNLQTSIRYPLGRTPRGFPSPPHCPAPGAGGAAGGEPEAGGGHGAGGDVVPSAAYVTQLYYKISRIDWDYEAEPAQIRGIHYGPDVAQPIDIDSSRHSRCFVSDYLWNLVPTAW
ncbi:kinetochore protein Spc24 [Porphyrio hochstetteri]